MSLDWGGGLFGSQNGATSSALEELQKVGQSRDVSKSHDMSRDLNGDDSDMDLSDGSELNMDSEGEEEDHVTEERGHVVEESVTSTNHVTQPDHVTTHVTEPTRFPSPSPDDDFISEMLGGSESREESREENASRDKSRDHPGTSHDHPTSSRDSVPSSRDRATRYITLYSGSTISRAKQYIRTTRLRTMQQEEESLKNHYGIDVSGIRRKLVDRKLDKEQSGDKPNGDKPNGVNGYKNPNREISFETSEDRAYTLANGIGSRDTHLWVEKLRPNKLFDLNGHSDRHKDILYWLSEWNSFIFQTPSEAVKFKAKQKEKWRNRDGHVGGHVGGNGGHVTKGDIVGHVMRGAAGSRDASDSARDMSRDTARPAKRILLVHGEPGTGKTTACAVLARHLGFTPLEMNASDDRGSEAFSRGVLAPMKSHSVTSRDRPNCIILDEIDGADPGFIERLVRLVERDEREELWFNRKKKSHKGSAQVMTCLVSRPIICIANNLHGLLYRLRPHCRVVNYGRLTSQQSLRILQNVFRTELSLNKLSSKQNRFLSDICSSVDGDIRQAINVLQFGNSENSNQVDKSALWNNIVASLFSHVPVGKERASHVSEIVQRSLRCGEWNKLVFGAFSTYITCLGGAGNLRLLTNITCQSDWLHVFDLAEKLGSRDSYHPYVLASYSLHFGATGQNKIDHVETDYQLTNQVMTHNLRLNDIHSNIPVELRRYLSKQTLLHELGMFLDHVTSQSRGVTLEQMTSLSESLKSLGISLKKESTFNDVTFKREEAFVFVPAVGELRIESRDSSREVSRDTYAPFLESLFKLLSPDPAQKRPGEFTQVQVSKKAKSGSRDEEKESRDEQNEEQQVESRDSKSSKKSSSKSSTLLDFFVKEKTVEITPSQVVRNEEQEMKDSLSTWVSYFEGYSNAVRRDLTWEQLWME